MLTGKLSLYPIPVIDGMLLSIRKSGQKHPNPAQLWPIFGVQPMSKIHYTVQCALLFAWAALTFDATLPGQVLTVLPTWFEFLAGMVCLFLIVVREMRHQYKVQERAYKARHGL